jgi:hypothetical protein
MHWADVIAKTLVARGRKHLISTGISPSGFIHVGSLREAITAEAVHKAVDELDADSGDGTPSCRNPTSRRWGSRSAASRARAAST